MFYSRAEAAIIANVVAKGTGITVKPGDQWCINMKTKVIEYPKDTWLMESDLGFIVHEAAHARFSWNDEKFFQDLKKVFEATNKDFNQLYDLFAVLEDIRVNSLISEIYPGGKKMIEAYIKNQADDFVTRLESTSKWGNAWFATLDTMHKIKMHNMSLLMLTALPPKYVWEIARSHFPENVIRVLDCSELFYQGIKTAKTQIQVMNVIKKILPRYIQLCDDVDPKKKIGEYLFSQLLEKLMTKIIPKLIQSAMARTKKGIKKVHISKDENCAGSQLDDVKIKAEDGKDNGNKEDNGLLGGKNFGMIEPEKKDYDITCINNKTDMIFPQIRKAMSILKDKEFVRYEGSYQSGRLQNRKLFKIFTGKTNIFTKKIAEADTKNLTFYILIDRSGSMKGSSEENALAGTMAICKALNANKKRFGIFGFASKFWQHKRLDQKFNDKILDDIVHNEDVENYHGSTCLGMAISKLNEVIDKSIDPNRNIVILMTDGCASMDGYDIKLEAEKLKRFAKVFPIGIQTDSILKHFPESKIVNEISDIGPILIDAFKQSVGKRIR